MTGGPEPEGSPADAAADPTGSAGPRDDLPVQPWHLPGFSATGDDGDGVDGSAEWERGETAAGAAFRTPRLGEERAAALAEGVRSAALRSRDGQDLEAVIRAVSGAAVRLADADCRWGRAAVDLLGVELGWPRPVARRTLRGMSASWTAGALRELVESELGDPGVLDGYRPAPAPDGSRRLRRAAGPPLLLQVEAGNVPGVGVTAMIRALLVRSGVVVRPSRSEPGLAALFARSLYELSPRLGRSVAVCWWPREAEAPWRQIANRSGEVVAYGGEEAVRQIRARLPGTVDLLAYGPKLGVAVLLPDADPDEAAPRLARDVCAYEQRGCVSPRIVLAPPDLRRDVARRLEEAIGDRVRRDGAAPLPPARAGALRQVRARAEFGAGEEAPRLVGDPDELRWTVLTGGMPELRSEALPRVVRVYGVEGLSEVRRLLGRHEGRVQALGYAGRQGVRELAAAAARTGVSRLSPLGTGAWPPADWRHDGRHQLLPLLRWTDWELGPSGGGPAPFARP